MTDRFDKFTERVRKVLQLAQEAAQTLGHNDIRPEHILLGLVREGDGVAARVLNNLGVDAEKVDSAIMSLHGKGKYEMPGAIGMTPSTKRIIELAVQEARNLHHHYLGTEHLLLGLIASDDRQTKKLLKHLRISAKSVRAQVIETLTIYPFGQMPKRGSVWFGKSETIDRFDSFTERARRVLQLAVEEAQRFNHNYIGTEHILLGIVREGNGVAARVLNDLGIELYKVRSAVEFIIGRGDRMIWGEIGLTPRAKRVIELAVDEARRLNRNYIGTEHLLLGLVREGEGIAAGILESLGVSLKGARAQVMQTIKSTGYSHDDAGMQVTEETTNHYEAILEVLKLESMLRQLRFNLLDKQTGDRQDFLDSLTAIKEHIQRLEVIIQQQDPDEDTPDTPQQPEEDTP